MTVWSPQQNEALSKAAAWLRMRYSPTFYLACYAGTGKTTLAMHLADQADGKVAFAAFTGKAARVMRSKGCKDASTVHSLIYWTDLNTTTGKTTIIRKSRIELDDYELIVIDECSMVDREMGEDLLSFGKPVLVLGDPAQLPPVNGAGYFTAGRPDFMLTDVHRQAAGSPIIALATDIRNGKSITSAVSTSGLTVTRKSALDPAAVTNADSVIVGRNRTRQQYNRRLRQLKGIQSDLPCRGEPLICLRNDKEKQISNGEIFLSERGYSVSGKGVTLTLADPDSDRKPFSVRVMKDFFVDDVAAAKLPFKQLRGTQQFTFGYAITCHKAQGSQWKNVCVFDESDAFRDDRARWLYTAVTRASEHLTLVI